MNTLLELFDEINRLDIITKNILESIVNQYDGNDWEDYIDVNFAKTNYNKKCAMKNDKIQLYIITWNINSESKIHDHPENGCIMKLLSGKLYEHTYFNDNNQLYFLGKKKIMEGDISYRESTKIIHKISNDANISVSLHIYLCEPNFQHLFYKESI